MTSGKWTLLAFVVLAHFLLDVLLMPIEDALDVPPGALDQMVFFLTLGCVVGQMNLIAAWAALAPGNPFWRLPWAAFLTVLVWYALVIGARVTRAMHELEEALVLFACILFGVLAAQIPLAVASYVKGWRLQPPNARDTSDISEMRQFNLRQLLVGMAVTSVALALGRIVLPPGDLSKLAIDNELLVIVPVVAVANVAVAAPCIWGAFAEGDVLLPLAVIWFLFAGVVAFVEVIVFKAIEGGPEFVEILRDLYLLNLGQCACVFGTMLVLRGMGFRLQCERFPA